MIPARIKEVRLKGFRSLADIELADIPQAAVLIGANGSGKSNFIRFFEMLSWMLKAHRLDEFVQRQGGASDQLFGGAEQTSGIEAAVTMETDTGRNDYRFTLAHAHPDRFIFTNEAFRYSDYYQKTIAQWRYLDSGHSEARIIEQQSLDKTAKVIVALLRNCAVYQFHDTSDSSNFKKKWETEDSNYLKSHGGNLAAVLHRLEQEDNRRFDLICRQINRILPVFDRFQIEESYGKVSLRWKAKNTSQTFGAHLTSDGSLRFFALVTLLNLPPEMLSNVVLLDEPELGLHPAAVNLVADMVKSVAGERQVIVATQSPLFVDSFDLEEILVLEFKDGRSQFRKLARNDYRNWLEGDSSFTTGELWQKNLLGGRP